MMAELRLLQTVRHSYWPALPLCTFQCEMLRLEVCLMAHSCQPSWCIYFPTSTLQGRHDLPFERQGRPVPPASQSSREAGS